MLGVIKMATAMFAETLDNFKRPTLLIPESRSCIQKYSLESLRTVRVFKRSNICDLSVYGFSIRYPVITARKVCGNTGFVYEGNLWYSKMAIIMNFYASLLNEFFVTITRYSESSNIPSLRISQS